MENKKTKIISIVAIVALALTVVTATYAYFQAQTGEGSQTDIKINANTVDTFTFATGNQITLNLDQESFASGKGNVTGSTFASALLTANNKTNTATEHYYLYLNISDNTFTYSINESTPEIIMTVTDSGGNEVTNISTLNHVIVTGANGAQVSGYDITNKNGLITLFNNREITTTSSKEEKWNITITFVNYDENQNANAGKSMNAKVVIQKGKIPLLADYVKSLYTGNQGDNGIYFHDSSLANGAGDKSYRYAGGDNDCYYNGEIVLSANSDASPNVNSCKSVYSFSIGNESIYFDSSASEILPSEKKVTWTDGACKTADGEVVTLAANNEGSVVEAIEELCQKNSYEMDGTRIANLNISHVGTGTFENLDNYVCFGSSASTCPTDNLYRIIGVFGDQVKLIKYDYANSNLLGTDGDYSTNTFSKSENSKYKGELTTINRYSWNYKNNTSINNGNGSNEWSTSLFNKINLNTNYLNNIGTTWSNMIENTTWKVSGHTTESVTPSAMYTAEITNATKTYGPSNGTSKIGLMYASDYGFAASPSAWTNSGSSGSANWMYMGLHEWTMTPYSSNSSSVFLLNSFGDLRHGPASNGNGVRPVLYLKASVPYAGGSGTKDSPITLVV